MIQIAKYLGLVLLIIGTAGFGADRFPTNLPNSVEGTGHATTDLLAAGPLRGESAPLSLPAAATGVALKLAAGEDNLRSAVIDPTGTFAYFGTSTNPGIVVKVRLSDMTRVGALKLAAGENDLHAAVIDSAGEFAYFGTFTSPGIVVKIRLSDFSRVGALKLNAGENNLRPAVIDSANGFAYFGTFTSPGRIIQVRLSDMTRVRALTLNPGEDLLFPAVIDSAAGFAYFGGRVVPGFIVKIRLSDLTRVAKLTMDSGIDSFHTGVIDPAGGYAYFASYTQTSTVIRVRLSDFTKAGTLKFNPGEGYFRTSVLDKVNGMIYFGTASDSSPNPEMIITMRLSDFSRVSALTLDPGQDKVRSLVIDPASRYIYFGTGSSPGIVVKLPTVGGTPTNTPTPTNAPTGTPTPTATPGTATNLLANPGFELDVNSDGLPDGWSTWARFTRSSAVVHGGAFAGRFRAANDSGATITQRVSNLTAGTTYNFAGWVNIPPTTDAFNLKLQVRWLNSANNTISTKTMKTYSAATAGWDQTAAALVAPAGTVKADIRLVVSSLSATIYVDDFSFATATGQSALP